MMTESSVPAAELTSRNTDREARRLELGAFLRSRRERLHPEDVGLPAGGRRRTPGLRREEVAQIAGIGVTWYTWLEQGRTVRPSVEVLDAIAGALQFDPFERSHLYLLATGHLPAPAPAATACAVVGSAHLLMLKQAMPYPACILTSKLDVLASNTSYRFLIADLDAHAEPERNCMLRTFLDPAWREAYADYPAKAAQLVARLRNSLTQHLDEPAWTGLVDRLRRESTLFDGLWQRHDLAPEMPSQPLRLRVPEEPGHTMTLAFTRMWLNSAQSVHLALLEPAGEADAAILRRRAAQLVDEPAVTTRSTVTAAVPEFA